MPASSPIEQARARWGQAEVLQGGGQSSVPPLLASKVAAQRVIARLVERDDRVHVDTVAELDRILTAALGFTKVREETGQVDGRRHLYYFCDHVMVRIKPDGSSAHPHAHMVITLVRNREDEADESAGKEAMEQLTRRESEFAKFDRDGHLTAAQVVPKLNPRASRTGLTVVQGGKGNPSKHDLWQARRTWGRRCHFDFAISRLP